jgi:signal peptidase I
MKSTDSQAVFSLRKMRLLWLFLKFSIAAIVIALPVRWFVAQPFLVAGDSMEPAFVTNQYLVIDKLWYRFHAPERGDVIIMRYPLDPSKYFVKRIVGLPGETVSMAKGRLAVIGSRGKKKTLNEPYVETIVDDGVSTTTLANDEYFVLGDNRAKSSDSREWGPLQKRFIVGRAYARLFPLMDLSLLPGQYRYSAE